MGIKIRDKNLDRLHTATNLTVYASILFLVFVLIWAAANQNANNTPVAIDTCSYRTDELIRQKETLEDRREVWKRINERLQQEGEGSIPK